MKCVLSIEYRHQDQEGLAWGLKGVHWVNAAVTLCDEMVKMFAKQKGNQES